jgi:hypothetical protein
MVGMRCVAVIASQRRRDNATHVILSFNHVILSRKNVILSLSKDEPRPRRCFAAAGYSTQFSDQAEIVQMISLRLLPHSVSS